MKAKKNKLKVSDLKKQGFKRTSIKGLYITDTGKGYNITTHKYLTGKKSRITFNGKQYNLAKLILETFCKIPIRSGQINVINGNEDDIHYSNLEYRTTPTQIEPNEDDLIKCVRLYFSVEAKFNKRSLLFKYYLNEVSKKRGFKLRTEKNKGSMLFFDWLDFMKIGKTKNMYYLSLEHGFTATNGKNEIYKYLNMLVDEVLGDFEKGILKVKDFYVPVRKKSKKQLVKQYLEFNKEFDKKVIELEKETEKQKEIEKEKIRETVARISKQTNHIHYFISDEILYESYNTIKGLRYLEVMEVAGMPNEKKCSEQCLFYIVKEYLE